MLVAYMTVKDPRAAIELYERALGASTTSILDGPGGMVMHAEVSIGGQRLMLSGEWPGMSSAPDSRSPVNFLLHVENADESLQRAVDAGMTKVQDAENKFWGDRMARASDGHGYEWMFVHTVEQLTPDEIQRRAAEFSASMGQ